MQKARFFSHFLAIFLGSTETPLFVQINVFFFRLGSEARQEIHKVKWFLIAAIAILRFGASKFANQRTWERAPIKDQKNSRFSMGIENFEREWNFRASHPPWLYFLWGNRDVEIEIFERDQTFRSRSKISIRIKFFWSLGPLGTWERAGKLGNSRKWSGEGCTKCFWTQGASISQESFAPSDPCFAPVRPWCAPVQEVFRLRWKQLSHPLLPDLLFLAFSGKGKENPPKMQEFSVSFRTPKSLEKEGKTLKKSKEFLARAKKQGNPKKEGKEDEG